MNLNEFKAAAEELTKDGADVLLVGYMVRGMEYHAKKGMRLFDENIKARAELVEAENEILKLKEVIRDLSKK